MKSKGNKHSKLNPSSLSYHILLLSTRLTSHTSGCFRMAEARRWGAAARLFPAPRAAGSAGSLPLAMASGNWPTEYNSGPFMSRRPAAPQHPVVPTRPWRPLFARLQAFCLHWFRKARAGVRSFWKLWCFTTRALPISFTCLRTVIKALFRGDRGGWSKTFRLTVSYFSRYIY